jgi:hypothetical protein
MIIANAFTQRVTNLRKAARVALEGLDDDSEEEEEKYIEPADRKPSRGPKRRKDGSDSEDEPDSGYKARRNEIAMQAYNTLMDVLAA